MAWVLLGGAAATTLLLAVELTSQGSRHVELAIHAMTRGAYARQFWVGGVLVGLLIPIAVATSLLATGTSSSALLAGAGLLAIIGMYAYEHSFVRAGQSVPLS